MCGIAGALGIAAPDGRDSTVRMLNAMVHRGPDQHGLWQSDGDSRVTLGHRRLSILDVSEAGRQPMVDAATGVVLSYNGEIYNFHELKSELEDSGHKFISTSDTEVLLHAYLEWGESALSKLRGMFAFAIWDPRDQMLLLVRDRLGIKPLYWFADAGRLIFASELRALLASGCVERKLDARSVHSYLWHGFVPGPRTLVDRVRLIEAGTIVRFDCTGSEISAVRYWELPRHGGSGRKSSSVPFVQHELQTAVTQHLQSDVPLGVFLSGGIDSSVIAAMASRASSKPVVTFNLRFEEGRYDESGYARTVANTLDTDHREVTLSEAVFASQLDDALESIDQPTFDAINTYFVSRAVREAGLTVALAGTGGDELFGGYSSFADIPRARGAARWFGKLPHRARRALARMAASALMGRPGETWQQTRWGKLADVMATSGDVAGLYQVSYGLFASEFVSELELNQFDDMRWGLDPEEMEKLSALIEGQPVLPAVSLLECSSFLRERLLRDTDAASMAVSLEVRVPLLDHAFVEAVAGLPSDQRFEPLRQKRFLREMIRDQIDPAVFDRDKAGFELPLEVWCRRRLAARLEETFQDINLAHACGLNAETVGRLWRAFKSGAPGIYWSRIWSLFIFMTWCRRHGVFA